jgi:hypothetical protein
MLAVIVQLATVGPLFSSLGLELLAIAYLTGAVIVCAAIPLTTGVHKGHVGLGIIAALITIPITILFTCIGGLLAAFVTSMIIQLIPKFDRPLLSQAEIEAEMRRMRGY